MLTSDFTYNLPPELIAQVPPKERGTSRMLVLHRGTGLIEHRHIADVTDYLEPGEVMVFNDTRVFSARAFGYWSDTPGAVEILLVEPSTEHPGAWSALCRSSRPARQGLVMVLAEGRIRAEVLEKTSDGRVELALDCDGDMFEVLDEFGRPPVPPYIRREKGDARVEIDKSRYQTVYARETGAVAAPTAGLHFSEGLLSEFDKHGVDREFVTLHVGPGTFRPVKEAVVEKHVMDAERYEVPEKTAASIAKAHGVGKRVIAVGSTSVRTLETCAAGNGLVTPGRGRSSIFIYPPYEWRVVDAMLTNFHLPCSTLLMMICALAGKELVFRAYHEAIEQKYMFYSYGDCMLIL